MNVPIPQPNPARISRFAALRLGPLRLRQQVLWMLAGITALSMLLLYEITTLRLADVAVEGGRHWAQAVARNAAAAATDKLTEHDDAGLESTLRDIASLPGVQRIDTLDAHGQPLLALEVSAEQRVLSQWRAPGLAAAPPSDDAVQAWAPVGAGGRLGSVGVRFSLAHERAHVQRLRFDAVWGIALVGLLSIVAAYALLARALAPLQRVARFSRSLATQAGGQLDEQGGSREVMELTGALNDASRTLREQLDALRQSDLRTHGILNAVPDAILGIDGQGRICSASPAVASIFGRESAELLGRPLAELLPGLSAEQAEQRTLAGLYMRASRTHVARFEAEALRHGGTGFPVEVSLARIEPEEGVTPNPQAMRYACAVRDVTDQRMLDAMLNLYVRALECSSNGVVISDMSLPGQPVIYANAAFYRITGYEPGYAIGRNCDFLQREDRTQPELDELRRAVAQGENATVVVRNYRADGSLFFNELSIAPVPGAEGAPRHYVGILNDVTERERTRLAIAERSARLNAVFDLSPDGFLVFDREGQLVYANRAFQSMSGWDESVVIQGLSLPEFEQRMHEMCDTAHAYPPLSMQAGSDGGFDTVDLLHLSRPRPRVLSRLARHNAGGQGESILYFRDVTHETEVDRMKSEFLTTAAHELRTPMVSVFGFTELLLQRPVPEGRRRDVLETIHRQASLLISMINDLLDLARIESRQGSDLRRTRVQVGELVRDTVERVSGASAGHELHVEIAPEHAALALLVDAAKTSQALTNVLSNGIKYSRPGTVVRVSSRLEERRLGLVVRDQGIGMSAEQLARVFERFYRADPSGNIPGTGLGMSLVKEIVEQQDGEVAVSSESGVGTEVTLWLPLARPMGEPTAGVLAAQAPA